MAVVSITVWLNTCPPPEHWSWYSVIVAFGIAGALQNRTIVVELSTITMTLRGGPAGTVQHNMSDITVHVIMILGVMVAHSKI